MALSTHPRLTSSDPIPSSHYDYAYFHGGEKSNYKRYDWESMGALFQALAHLLTTAFPTARRYLDVGAATGLLVTALREQGVEAWGLEHSAYCIEAAHPVAKPWMLHQSLDALALGPHTWDIVTACETLEHLTPLQLDGALRELRQHVTLGLFATIPCTDMVNRAAWRLAKAEPSHITLESRAWWIRMFEQAGFTHTPFHVLAERYMHTQPLVEQMGWNVLLFGV